MMNGKECRATRREIDESELNQRLSDQARAHVAKCSSCRGFRAERASLRELVGSLEPIVAPGDFEMRLRARIAGERQDRARQPFIFRLIMRPPVLAAAALVFVLTLSVGWFAQRNGSKTPEIAKVLIKEEPAGSKPPELVVKKDEAGQGSDVSVPGGIDIKPDRPSRAAGTSGRESLSKSSPASVSANDYSDSRAESFKQIEQRVGEVSLSAPLKPMVVSIQDNHGATRQISLPPVSFGAQRMVDNRTPVSFSSNSRSW
jgi:hypothetical protein